MFDLANMKCKNIKNSVREGLILREFFHSLPYCEIRPMRVKIADALGVRENTVVQWITPCTFRVSFTKLQKAAIEQTAGRKIF